MDNPHINKSLGPVEKLELTQDWDKVFPLSDKVNHKKGGLRQQVWYHSGSRHVYP